MTTTPHEGMPEIHNAADAIASLMATYGIQDSITARRLQLIEEEQQTKRMVADLFRDQAAEIESRDLRAHEQATFASEKILALISEDPQSIPPSSAVFANALLAKHGERYRDYTAWALDEKARFESLVPGVNVLLGSKGYGNTLNLTAGGTLSEAPGIRWTKVHTSGLPKLAIDLTIERDQDTTKHTVRFAHEVLAIGHEVGDVLTSWDQQGRYLDELTRGQGDPEKSSLMNAIAESLLGK